MNIHVYINFSLFYHVTYISLLYAIVIYGCELHNKDSNIIILCTICFYASKSPTKKLILTTFVIYAYTPALV